MMSSLEIRIVDWHGPEQVALRHIRELVFIREQGVPKELEWDTDDLTAVHLLACFEGEVAGVARLLPDGHIGRVAVLAEFRGRGIGTALMQHAMAAARERGLGEALLNAQTAVIPLYEKLGFVAEGPEFIDAGIPHRHMRRIL